MNWEQVYRELLKQYNQVKTEYERAVQRIQELESQPRNGASAAAAAKAEVVAADVASPANYEATQTPRASNRRDSAGGEGRVYAARP